MTIDPTTRYPYYYNFSNDRLELEFYKLAEAYNQHRPGMYETSHNLIGIANLFEDRTGIKMRKPRIVKAN